MAFTGVRLKQPWEAEVEKLLDSVRFEYPDKSNLLYLIHPGSAGDYDHKEVAKEGVKKELEAAVTQNQRAILIYPTDGGVYIDPTKVTDIRGGCDEYKWIEREDLSGVEQATFVGGKLRKCLGHSYGTLVRTAKQGQIQEVRVRLPLDSIYTEDGNTAAQEFLAGIEIVGEVKSLCALLTPINGNVSYHKSGQEYGFIYPFAPWMTKLHLNGQHISTFGMEQDITPVPDGWVRTSQYQDRVPLEVNLLVECDTTRRSNHESLATKANHRWERIREDLAPYINARK